MGTTLFTDGPGTGPFRNGPSHSEIGRAEDKNDKGKHKKWKMVMTRIHSR